MAVDDPKDLDLLPLKSKSISWLWEFVFTRPLFAPEDNYQHHVLERIAALVDAGKIVSTRTRTMQGINAATLREAHREVEGSDAIGKLVVTA